MAVSQQQLAALSKALTPSAAEKAARGAALAAAGAAAAAAANSLIGNSLAASSTVGSVGGHQEYAASPPVSPSWNEQVKVFPRAVEADREVVAEPAQVPIEAVREEPIGQVNYQDVSREELIRQGRLSVEGGYSPVQQPLPAAAVPADPALSVSQWTALWAALLQQQQQQLQQQPQQQQAPLPCLQNLLSSIDPNVVGALAASLASTQPAAAQSPQQAAVQSTPAASVISRALSMEPATAAMGVAPASDTQQLHQQLPQQQYQQQHQVQSQYAPAASPAAQLNAQQQASSSSFQPAPAGCAEQGLPPWPEGLDYNAVGGGAYAALQHMLASSTSPAVSNPFQEFSPSARSSPGPLLSASLDQGAGDPTGSFVQQLPSSAHAVHGGSAPFEIAGVHFSGALAAALAAPFGVRPTGTNPLAQANGSRSARAVTNAPLLATPQPVVQEQAPASVTTMPGGAICGGQARVLYSAPAAVEDTADGTQSALASRSGSKAVYVPPPQITENGFDTGQLLAAPSAMTSRRGSKAVYYADAGLPEDAAHVVAPSGVASAACSRVASKSVYCSDAAVADNAADVAAPSGTASAAASRRASKLSGAAGSRAWAENVTLSNPFLDPSDDAPSVGFPLPLEVASQPPADPASLFPKAPSVSLSATPRPAAFPQDDAAAALEELRQLRERNERRQRALLAAESKTSALNSSPSLPSLPHAETAASEQLLPSAYEACASSSQDASALPSDDQPVLSTASAVPVPVEPVTAAVLAVPTVTTTPPPAQGENSQGSALRTASPATENKRHCNVHIDLLLPPRVAATASSASPAKPQRHSKASASLPSLPTQQSMPSQLPVPRAQSPGGSSPPAPVHTMFMQAPSVVSSPSPRLPRATIAEQRYVLPAPASPSRPRVIAAPAQITTSLSSIGSPRTGFCPVSTWTPAQSIRSIHQVHVR